MRSWLVVLLTLDALATVSATADTPDHEVVVGATTYAAQGASFGPALDTSGIVGVIVAAVDGTPTRTDGCEPIVNNIVGKIALVDRGGCDFTVKVRNAQDVGALGVVVADNGTGPIAPMGGADSTISIPSVLIALADGQALRASLLLGPAVGILRRVDLIFQDGFEPSVSPLVD